MKLGAEDAQEVEGTFSVGGEFHSQQIAEGFLRSAGGERFEVTSGGIKPDEALNPLAVEVMAELGIDISQQRSKSVAELIKERFAYVITLCDLAKERSPIFPFTPNLLRWNFIDPTLAEIPPKEILMAFRHVRDELKGRIQIFVDEVIERDTPASQVEIKSRSSTQ